jgi:hypothetical protein
MLVFTSLFLTSIGKIWLMCLIYQMYASTLILTFSYSIIQERSPVPLTAVFLKEDIMRLAELCKSEKWPREMKRLQLTPEISATLPEGKAIWVDYIPVACLLSSFLLTLSTLTFVTRAILARYLHS